MRVEVADAFPEADVLAVPVGQGGIPAGGDLQGAARIAEEEDLAAKAGRTAVLFAEEPSKRVVLVGLGPADELDADTVRTAAASVAQATERIGGTLAWLLDDSLPQTEQARAVVDGLILGTYDPGRWKSDAEPDHPFKRLVLVGGDPTLAESAERVATIADGANRARDLANTGANVLTPEKLAERASEIASGHEHLTAEALGPDEFTELGMGAFAGVAQGSHNPARMIVIRYDPPAAKGDVLLGLVGKAITFDTGGISIKPALYMEDMKGDMSGGGAVVESMGVIAELGLPLRALAVVAASENAVGGGAFRPGDILTAMNGKTIEITNTDAE
ncbi:MAG: aminopeptidase, partial [Actinobacteria bacterium]